MPMIRRFGQALALAVALVVSSAAQPHANETASQRPIKILVGFGGGGPTDILARALADQLAKSLGRQIVVENKVGASGNIATQAAAASPADGNTLLIGASPLAVNHSLFPDFPIKFGRDLIAIAPLGQNENVLVAHPSVGVRDLNGFVKVLRERPGAISYAALGQGSSSHLAGVAFDQFAGTKMVPVMYRGGGEAQKDLLGGHVQAWFAPIPSVLDSIRAGQLVALATTGPKRASWLPQLPTVAETYPGFDVRLWVGLFAPAGLDAKQVQALENATVTAMSSEEMKRVMDGQGIAPFAVNRAEFSAFVAREIERWKTVVAAIKS